jgi:hypothetical protein
MVEMDSYAQFKLHSLERGGESTNQLCRGFGTLRITGDERERD